MRANLFIKVEVDYEDKGSHPKGSHLNDTPEKLAEHICRQIQKVYGVRKAELSHITPED
jgi:hypothetical protein